VILALEVGAGHLFRLQFAEFDFESVGFQALVEFFPFMWRFVSGDENLLVKF